MSCWERLKMKILSKNKEENNKKKNNTTNITCMAAETSRLNNRSGGLFRYDALSYAQNFDEGLANADEEGSHRSFSARYAIPSQPPTKKLG